MNEKLVGADATDAVQNGVKEQIGVLRLRFAQPPIGENGEFLRPSLFAAIQGQAAGRHPIDLSLAQQPEITGTLEGAQFVPFIRRTRGTIGAHAGEVGPIQIDAKTGKFIQMHRFLVKIAQVEELDPERQAFLFPERLVVAELDLAVIIVSQLAQKIGQIGARGMEGLMRALFGLFGHVIKGDMHRLHPWKSEGWTNGAENQRQR